MNPQDIPWYIWYVSGALTSIGLLILLDDRISGRITSKDNLGWLLLATGILLLVGWFVIPFFPVIWAAIVMIWERSTTTMLIALLLGALLATTGGILMWRRSHP